MTGVFPTAVPVDTGHVLFEAHRARQRRSVLTHFARTSTWLLPEDLRELAGVLLAEADAREAVEAGDVA
jgi:hypothetical protein